MNRSLNAIGAIARITLTEALRQKTLNIVLLFSLVLLGGSDFFTQFSFQEEFKFLKDLAYAVISISGLLVALMGAAQLIPAEIERRTLYTTLSKPVHRFEFVLGKYLGLLLLLTLIVGIMSAVFCGVLFWKEARVTGDILAGASGPLDEGQQRMIDAVRAQSRDPGMIQAVALVWCKLAVTAAISVFFSTIATSTIFIVSTTLMIYFAGHLQAVARQLWLHEEASSGFLKQGVLVVVSWLVPDFQAYNLIDEIIAGNPVHWADSAPILLYSFFYVVVIMAVAGLVFEEREL
ncbi:MAG: ABC transporter permease subunit [Candidatus Methylacidiphilales bacterium]|nr:ABC transporter permease subunit [Candidatus Methylacidiphilales bacterium]